MYFGSFGENFPYTNFHDLNLDWIIREMKKLNINMENFVDVNQLKIADPIQWSIETAYERFTIVSDNNALYLSTQAVPYGIAITNTDYWTKLFDFPEDAYEAIAELEEEFNQFKEDVEDELDKSTLNIKNRKVLFCGDSYTTQNNSILFTSFVTSAGLTPANCHNIAVSGSSFLGSQWLFLTQIQNYAGDRNEITDIVVAGGINDALLAMPTNWQALRSAISDFYTYVKNNYPNATMWLGYIGGCKYDSEYYSTHNFTSQEYVRWVYTEVSDLGIKLLNAYNIIHTASGNYLSDGLHPNSYTASQIGSALGNSFIGHEKPVFYPTYEMVLTGAGSAETEVVSRNGRYQIVNDIVKMNLPGATTFHIKADEVLGQTAKQIGTLSNAIVSANGFTGMTTVLLQNFNDDTDIYEVPAIITVSNNSVNIQIMELHGSTFKTYTANSEGAILTLVSNVPIIMPTVNIN